MKIVILGNLASGKSTLAHEIAHQIGLPLLSLDMYREELAGQGKPFVVERMAKSKFISDVQTRPSCVLEIVPYGYTYSKIQALIGLYDIIVRIDCSAEQCLSNLRNRTGKLPICYTLDDTHSVYAIADALKKVKPHIVIKFPFRKQAIAQKIINYARARQNSL